MSSLKENESFRREKKTLTIFTTVMDSKDDPQRYLAQLNCISLLAELPSTNVIVYTDNKEWVAIAKSIGVYTYKSIKSNEFGTPYLKSMFLYAIEHFNSDFYGYVNADILLDKTLIETLKVIQGDIAIGKISPKVYIVGQRTNVQQDEEDQFDKRKEDALSFVVRMLNKGHRYWDSAVDYHIVSKATFDWSKMPDFVIGRAGYDIYLVHTSYKDESIVLIDLTNTVHCAHMLSKDGNRSGLKRKTPDKNWNSLILSSSVEGCCEYKYFGKYANKHSVLLNSGICIAEHGFQGYYDDSYYDAEKEFIKKSMNQRIAEECLIVSENDVLGVLSPFCSHITVIIINQQACERTYKRLTNCGMDIQLGCNREQVSSQELVMSLFQRIDTRFDLVLVQSDKPMTLINWIHYRLSVNGVLIMRHWLDPVEQKRIEKELSKSFVSLGTYPFLMH